MRWPSWEWINQLTWPLLQKQRLDLIAKPFNQIDCDLRHLAGEAHPAAFEPNLRPDPAKLLKRGLGLTARSIRKLRMIRMAPGLRP